MLREAIRGINTENIKNIIIVANKEHIDKYNVVMDVIVGQFSDIDIPTSYILMDSTESQVETVSRSIEIAELDGPIIIKDCDNQFVSNANFSSDIGVCVINLGQTTLINPSNKSYVRFDPLTGHAKITEKIVSSDIFCCGLYYFNSSCDFLRFKRDSLFISDVINNMLINNKTMSINHASCYMDWGTLEDWFLYISRMDTIYCDIDGVLIENSGSYSGTPRGSGLPILDNIGLINDKYRSGATIILTTSRATENKNDTIKELNSHGIMYHRIIFDLPHSHRTIINDFAATNPFPSCSAINIQRNSNSLGDFL